MRLLILIGLLLVPSSSSAAPGINLFWGDCPFSGIAQSNLNDDCLTDAGGPYDLVMSFNPDGVIPNVVGAEGVIEIVVESTLPDFWRLEPGGCRQGALSLNVDFPGTGYNSCPEAWSQSAGVSSSLLTQPFFPCNNRIRLTWTVLATNPVVFDNSVAPDWYLARLRLTRDGTTICAGCTLPACFWAPQLTLFRPAGDPDGDVLVTADAITKYAAWQGGGSLWCPILDQPPGDPSGCPTPVQDQTWGQIKSMYR